MALTPGTRLGPYEVIAQIGAGGMGEVYKATDTNLKRQVAIKVLPASLAGDAERLARFQREAEVLAALNHPNIAAIYGLEKSEGTVALVMELVEGDDLSQRIARGAIPIDEALPIAKQIAEALEAAHEQGIIHRDLKPANIKVRSDGTVKVLDFGLAKAMEPPGAMSVSVSQAPTITTPAMMTGVGMILGTAAYRSPEQARGKTVDKRADIWAFGAVLYEMLTSRRAFADDDVSLTLSRVLQTEPDYSALPAQLPSSIEPALRWCLQKDSRQRARDIADVRALLEGRVTSGLHNRPDNSPSSTAAIAKAARARNAAVVAAAVFATAAVVMAALLARQPSVQRRTLRMTVLPSAGVILADTSIPAISPDGQTIAFAAARENTIGLWVRDLGSLDSRLLAGTEGAALPFWSPDSRSIAFFADGRIKRVDLVSGSVTVVCDAGGQGRGGTWNQDGTIVFAGFLTPLYQVPASGGARVAITTISPDEPAHRYPWFLPDGRHYLYTAYGSEREKHQLFVGELGSSDRTSIMRVTSNVVYANGHILFVRQQHLMAQPFDVGVLATTGDAFLVAERISYSPVDVRGSFSASASGMLVFTSLEESDRRQLAWLDRTGQARDVIETPGLNPRNPALSPDGKLIAFRSEGPEGNGEVWVHDTSRKISSRLTARPWSHFFPIWSPDQQWVAYFATPGGDGHAYRRSANGSGVEEELNLVAAYPTDWSKDGSRIIYHTLPRPGEGWNVGVLTLPGDVQPSLILRTPANERAAKLSPDGRWLAYASDESGRDEVYVQSFPTPARGRWQISSDGGVSPMWSRDGRELFYASLDQQITAVPVQQGASFSVGQPSRLFRTRIDVSPSNGNAFDVGADGRFLVAVPLTGDSAPTPLTVVLDWLATPAK